MNYNEINWSELTGSRFFNDDCMRIMSAMPDKWADLAIVDPPYFKGVGKIGYFGERISNTNVVRGNYSIPTWNDNIPNQYYLNELCRVSKNQIIWGINYYNFFHCVGRIIWDKMNDSSSFSKCEIASCTLHDSVQIYRFMWNGMLQGDMANKEKRIHPTQKPVALYEWLLTKYAKKGDKILDTHGGSMSIAIACHNLGFDLTACELDKDYYDAATKRINFHVAQKRLFKP